MTKLMTDVGDDECTAHTDKVRHTGNVIQTLKQTAKLQYKRYEKMKFLGEGQFARVFMAKDKVEDKIVAVKKIKLGGREETADGVHRTAIREIMLQKEIRHPNCVGLLDVVASAQSVSLVFPFMITDMEKIVRDQDIILLPQHIKNLMAQTLCGLQYLHASWILHRDLKPNNLLVDQKGLLKIADYGLARKFGSPIKLMESQVVTRWYRSPELLMGSRQYGVGVDMWSIGCIFGELLQRAPLFPGTSDIEQISKIAEILGTPTTEYWQHMESLPDFVKMKHFPGIPLKSVFHAAADDQIQVLMYTLAYDPLLRYDCTQLLAMPYFRNHPLPCANKQLPLGRSNTEKKTMRHAKRRKNLSGDTESTQSKRKLVFDQTLNDSISNISNIMN